MEAKVLSTKDHKGQTDVLVEVSLGTKKVTTSIRVNLHPKEAEPVALAQAIKDAELHLGGSTEGSQDDV